MELVEILKDLKANKFNKNELKSLGSPVSVMRPNKGGRKTNAELSTDIFNYHRRDIAIEALKSLRAPIKRKDLTKITSIAAGLYRPIKFIGSNMTNEDYRNYLLEELDPDAMQYIGVATYNILGTDDWTGIETRKEIAALTFQDAKFKARKANSNGYGRNTGEFDERYFGVSINEYTPYYHYYKYNFKGNKKQIQEKAKKVFDMLCVLPYHTYEIEPYKSYMEPINYFQNTPADRDPLNRPIRDILSLVKFIDTGDNLAHTDSQPDLCVPAALAEAINSKGTRHLSKMRNSPIIDTEYLYLELKEIRRNAPPSVNINGVEYKILPIAEDEPGFTMLELYQLCVKMRIKFLFVHSADEFKPLINWTHPDNETDRRRYLLPGISCVMSSGHLYNMNTVLSVGVSVASVVLKKARITDWMPCNRKNNIPIIPDTADAEAWDQYRKDKEEYKTYPTQWLDYYEWLNFAEHNDEADLNDFIKDNRNIIYVNKGYRDLLNAFLQQGIIPQMHNGAFSLKKTLFKFVDDAEYKPVRKFCDFLKIQYTGQRTTQIIYKYFEDKIYKSYLNERVYSLMTGYQNGQFGDSSDGLFRFHFNCHFSNYNPKSKNLKAFDVRKSYYHALCNMPVPVFTIDNDVEPFNRDIVDCGFYLITRDDVGFPTHGKSFIAGFMLKALIDDNKLTLDDVSHQLIPTYQEPAGHAKEYVDIIYKYFNKSGPNILNGQLGAKSKQKNSHEFYTSDYIEVVDAMNRYEKAVGIDEIKTDNGTIYKVECTDATNPQYVSHLPIHFMTYQYSIYHLYTLIKKLKLKNVVAIATDCIIIDDDGDYSYIPNKTQENNDVIGLLTRENKIIDTRTKEEKKAELMTAEERRQDKEDKKYRVHVPSQLYKPYVSDKVFDLSNDIKITNIDKMSDRDPILKNIINGTSYAINAEGGSGKSYFCRQLIEYARLNNKNIAITGATAVAAYNLDKKNGQTLHKFMGIRPDIAKDEDDIKLNLNDYWGSKVDIIVIDEFWFLTSYIVEKIMRKKIKYNTTLIILGDTYQLSIGKTLAAHGSIYKTLVDNNYLELTENRRFKCDVLKYYAGLQRDYIAGKIPRPSIKMFKADHHPLAICWTNATRERINDYWTSKQKNLIKFDGLPFEVCVGMPVIARINDDQYKNSQHFIINRISKRSETLELKLTDINGITDESEADIVVKLKDFARDYERSYCITTHTAQGKTIKIPYSIYEADKVFNFSYYDKTNVSRKWFYVAISRAERMEQINICSIDCLMLDVVATDKEVITIV